MSVSKQNNGDGTTTLTISFTRDTDQLTDTLEAFANAVGEIVDPSIEAPYSQAEIGAILEKWIKQGVIREARPQLMQDIILATVAANQQGVENTLFSEDD